MIKTAITIVLALFCSIGCGHRAEAGTISATTANYSDVSAAVASAGRGDTVVVPARPAVVTWSSTLYLSKGIFLKGPGRDSLTIKSNGTMIFVAPDATAISNDEVIRVEGFTFDGTNTSSFHIQVCTNQNGGNPAGWPLSPSNTKPFDNLAIGNCRFKNSKTTSANNGAIFTQGQIRGVIYGNIFDRCNVILKCYGNDDPNEWAQGNFPQSFGTADNLYFEGNTIQFSSAFSGDAAGWMESGQSGRYVVRYNTWNMINATNGDLFDVHGFQNWPDNGETGTMVSEVYGNTWTNTTGYRWIAYRGGWGLIFNNILTGTNLGDIQAWDNSGECPDLVPGAIVNGNLVFDTRVNNTYCFNNAANGFIKSMYRFLNTGTACSSYPTLENQQFYNYNANFDGSVGIGLGTTAPTMSATDGVGYWQNSTPTPSTDPNVIQAGTLYKRVSGAWIAYYTPYTYPHPLSSTATPTPTPTATASPTPTPFPGRGRP